MYKVAICDDDIYFLEKLSVFLDEYTDNFIFTYYSNPFELLTDIDIYHVVIIDYEMPGLSAFDFFEMTKDKNFLRIIISAHEGMVYSSFIYNIFWFVRKKYLQTEMNSLIIELEKYYSKVDNMFRFKTKNEIILLPYDEIIHICTEGNYIILHCVNSNSLKIRCTFKELEKHIESSPLIIPRCGMAVNMKYVRYINTRNCTIKLVSGESHVFTKKQRNIIINAYNNYIAKKSYDSFF